MNRILVTGSAGHLDEAMMRTLRRMDRDAIGLDILPSPFTDVVGSITNSAMLEGCMKGVDAVVHAATLHKPHVAAHTREARRVLGREPQGERAPAPPRGHRGRRRRAPGRARAGAGARLRPPHHQRDAPVPPRGRRGELRRDVASVLDRRVPEWRAVYDRLGWRLLPRLDRVYDNARARTELGWQPKCDFSAVLQRASSGAPRAAPANRAPHRAIDDAAQSAGPVANGAA